MSFGRLIFDTFARFGDRVAMIEDRDQLTYAEALGQAGRVAANLFAQGIRPGDRVGLGMQNNLDVLLSMLACWRLDATVAVFDFRAPRSQRARQARDFELAVVFESREMPGDDVYPNVLFDRSWRFSSPAGNGMPDGMDCSHPAFLLFSSGTTGDPKAYIQSHDALAVRATRTRQTGDGKRFLTPMSQSYSATRHNMFHCLLHGGSLIFSPPLFSPSELIEALLSYRANGSALPPPVVSRMVREIGVRPKPFFPDLEVLASIGGPLRAEDKIAIYHNLTPGYRMSYASALTGPVSGLFGKDVLLKPDSSGRLEHGVRVEILDDDGNALPVGETGRIKAWTSSMASAVLMPGNRVFVDPEVMGAGWGMAGDRGFLDEDGFLTIVGRDADMIIRGGVNVAPQELEKLIRSHPKVVEVAVVGFPDEIMGQEIAAFIISHDGTVDEFRDFLRTNVAADRRPRVVRLVKSLPYNQNGKLMRRTLVDQLDRSSEESVRKK